MNSKFKVVVLFLILTLFLFAQPTTGGGINDLVTVPGADIMIHQNSISGEIYSNDDFGLEAVHRLYPDLEIGLSYFDEEAGLLVKYNIIAEDIDQPALSAGVKGRTPFLVMSREMTGGFRGHAGLSDGGLGTLFIGFEKIYNPTQVKIGENGEEDGLSWPPMKFMVEFAGGDFNTGLRANFDQNLYLDLAIIDFNDLKLGFNYTF